MAQFTAQGRLKLLFNGETVSSLMVQTHKRRTSYKGSSSFASRFHYASSSYLRSKVKCCNAEARPSEGVHDEYAYVFEYDEDDDDDDVFEGDGLSGFRGLVLDISYRPVNVVCWKRAICLEFMEKADVLEYYDKTVNSPSGSFYIPAVLRVRHLLQVIKRRRVVKNSLSRKNILFRDNYTCQYCSSHENLTIDHVVPAALGGEWTWENLVTACSKCNSKKGRKSLEEAKMKLMKVPKKPKDYDILAIPLTAAALRVLTARKGTPDEWRQYLSSS
ncbi:putative HNH nuclease [Medicago truncatula]|uniref:HNH endonuclease domain protein n=1 Tax=Medicago truncatula TaxID=3880 RepID=A2Q5Q1_MEDTR|nr:uncharacterized protein LOC11437274 [Medicago truncatula]ABN09813.1 HNH nuclease [Medicago truncatula]AES80830.1 HNH endonuclease domain protein [Medicago truncatula]RHN47448.1 putative HNH nuclease [Medicago truncatula]